MKKGSNEQKQLMAGILDIPSPTDSNFKCGTINDNNDDGENIEQIEHVKIWYKTNAFYAYKIEEYSELQVYNVSGKIFYKFLDSVKNYKKNFYEYYKIALSDGIMNHTNNHNYAILQQFLLNHYILPTLLTCCNEKNNIIYYDFPNVHVIDIQIMTYLKVLSINDILDCMFESCNNKIDNNSHLVFRTISIYLLDDCLFLYNICNETAKVYIISRLSKLFWKEIEYSNVSRYDEDVDEYLFLLFSSGFTPNKHGFLLYNNSSFHRSCIEDAYNRYLTSKKTLRILGNKIKMPVLDNLVMEYLIGKNHYEEHSYKNNEFHEYYARNRPNIESMCNSQ